MFWVLYESDKSCTIYYVNFLRRKCYIISERKDHIRPCSPATGYWGGGLRQHLKILFHRVQAGANLCGSADVLPAGAVARDEVVNSLLIETVVAHFAARCPVGVLDPFLMVAAVARA